MKRADPAQPRLVENAQTAAAVQNRPFWRRFLYVDVVLPLIAVLVVFAVLLAWVG